MDYSAYQKALEIIIESKKITVCQLTIELVKLGINKEEALSTINKIVESPLVKYTSDLIEII